MKNLDLLIKEDFMTMVATDRLYAELSKESGISSTQMMILYYLEYNKEVSQKNLCIDLYLSKQTINSILGQWKEEGIVTLCFADGNQKNKIITLTERGQAYLKKSLFHLHEVEKKVMMRMGEQRIKEMMEGNRLYLKYLKEEVEKRE